MVYRRFQSFHSCPQINRNVKIFNKCNHEMRTRGVQYEKNNNFTHCGSDYHLRDYLRDTTIFSNLHSLIYNLTSLLLSRHDRRAVQIHKPDWLFARNRLRTDVSLPLGRRTGNSNVHLRYDNFRFVSTCSVFA